MVLRLLGAGEHGAFVLGESCVHVVGVCGAVCHHVANKDDLLAAATDDVITRVMAGGSPPA